MRRLIVAGLWIWLLGVIPGLGLAGGAAQVAAGAMPVYRPPLRGAPAARVGGGTRGAAAQSFTLSVLAPDHVGLTSQPQPTLFWYLSRSVQAPLVVTLIDDAGVEPLLEAPVEPPVRPGIHAISLRRAGIRLRPDRDYQWFVSVVNDPRRRALDVVAGGGIRYHSPDEALARRLVDRQGDDRVRAFAEAGFWYDAISTLGDLIDHSTPARRALLRRERASLLTQVGLLEAAHYEAHSSP